MASIIEAMHGERGKNPFKGKINEAVEIEPIGLVLGVLSGIFIGSLLWYLGLA